MYFTEISMQLISMLSILIIGLYFFMFVFSFYRREKRRTREQDVRRYTFEYCTKEMKKLNICIHNQYDKLRTDEGAFFSILDIFERLAVGVYTEVLNDKIVIMYFGSYMQNFYKDYRLNLFEMRKRINNAGLYANYERFMEEWDFRWESSKSLDNRRTK